MKLTKHSDRWEDESGNTSYFDYFGSEEAAKDAIESLDNCKKCRNCSGCSDCSDCSRCSGVTEDPWKAKVDNLNSAVRSEIQKPGCFDMGNWHCGTSHCWAGWIVTLAGDLGKSLESNTSTEFAAMKIFHNSTGERINPGWFYLGNDEARAKIEELAKSEQS